MVAEIPKTIFKLPLIFKSPDDVQTQNVSKSKISRKKNTDPVMTRYIAIIGTMSQ